MAEAEARGSNGRFKPGFSGNPKGKAKGTRHRRTILAEMMREGEREIAGRVVIESAVKGNLVAAKFLFPWHTPRPRGRLLDLELPEGRRPADIADAYDIVQAALCAAEITIDEALLYARFLEARAAAFRRLAEFERELAERRPVAAAPAAEHAAEPPSPRPSPPMGARENEMQGNAAREAPSPAPEAREGTRLRGEGEEATASPPVPLHSASIPPSRLPAASPASPRGGEGRGEVGADGRQSTASPPAPLHSASIPPARTPAAAAPPQPQMLPPPRRRPRRWRWDGKTTWMAG